MSQQGGNPGIFYMKIQNMQTLHVLVSVNIQNALSQTNYVYEKQLNLNCCSYLTSLSQAVEVQCPPRLEETCTQSQAQSCYEGRISFFYYSNN